MAGEKRGGPRGQKPMDYGGMDPRLMASLVSKIPKNAVTGRVDLPDIMKYMSQHPDEMDALMASVKDLDLESKNVDFSTYDFPSLAPTIKHESFWVLQLEHLGMVDASGRPRDPAAAHTSSGVRHTFMIYCYDDQEQYRVTHECDGLPTSTTVLQVLQRAIAKPLPPLKPALPWLLLLSIKFEPHISDLKPFLDSLPAPFHWRLETRTEADSLKEGIYQLNENGAQKALESAHKLKASGNASFGRKDRTSALKAYSDAINALDDVLAMTPDIKDEKQAKKQLAICFGNRAAAYLMPGEGMDAVKALHDGEAAEAADPSYAKAYIRQATAQQIMGKSQMAKDVIARALRLPGLEDDGGLVDRLIELYTDGKGLSDNEEVFKNWTLDICINDARSSKRLRGIKGEWRRRLDAQFAKWKR
ncbi:hypothetical protein Hypma_008832 [Hypsizygus marmoreus]|uniref:Uncharacterized protein n=1 Tax=Hypsizygus marmoreus TaxID=39966 RepID=A0A369JQ70_HYPMA|nr:hypothetical protein Hypma_008832 [Hypsizygus marmoreus]